KWPADAKMRPPLDGSVILITGASAGIGHALARRLAPHARALVLVARRADRLSALDLELRARHSHLRVLPVPCDITDRAAVDAMLAGLEREVSAVDVLINNAGMGDYGMYEQSAWPKIERLIQLNVIALAYLTRRLLPAMVARGRG